MAERMQIDEFQEMLGWLSERPELPLPVHGSWAMPPTGERYGEDGSAYHVFAGSRGEFEALSGFFDRIEEAPKYPFNPVGVRRRFGSVAYEVLLDERLSPATLPWSPRRLVASTEAVRSARLVGLFELIGWLRERPPLPLPLLEADAFPVTANHQEEVGLVFRVGIGSHAEHDALARSFDQIDRPDDLPSYVEDPVRRDFAGGIGYELVLGD